MWAIGQRIMSSVYCFLFVLFFSKFLFSIPFSTLLCLTKVGVSEMENVPE